MTKADKKFFGEDKNKVDVGRTRKQANRTYLYVSFDEKEAIKALGGKWDAALRQWYVEDVTDMQPFMRWVDHRLMK